MLVKNKLVATKEKQINKYPKNWKAKPLIKEASKKELREVLGIQQVLKKLRLIRQSEQF